MPAIREEETDSLASLEERIHRAVELLTVLREEKTQAERQRDEAVSELETSRKETVAALDKAQRVAQELDDLRSERKQVRTRIEKLLGQMDLLSNA